MKYRIKEQYGYFVIEKEVEVIKYEHTVLSFFFHPYFFHPKEVKSKEWGTIWDTKSNISAYLRNPLKFKTIEETYDYINKLEPKYHDVMDVAIQIVNKAYPITEEDCVNAAIKSVSDNNFEVIAVKGKFNSSFDSKKIVDINGKQPTHDIMNVVNCEDKVCYIGNGVYNCKGNCQQSLKRNDDEFNDEIRNIEGMNQND